MLVYARNITFCGDNVLVACDGRCDKAWGLSSRPTTHDAEHYLADDELEIAPANPGTSEGGILKPASLAAFPNKWCVRECERSAMADASDNRICLPDWSHRRST